MALHPLNNGDPLIPAMFAFCITYLLWPQNSPAPPKKPKRVKMVVPPEPEQSVPEPDDQPEPLQSYPMTDEES